MVKTLQKYSATADDNLELTGDGGTAIPLGEGKMMPRHINDAIRAMMADMAIDAKGSGRPSSRSQTMTVKQITDQSATGHMPAVATKKVEVDGAMAPLFAVYGTSTETYTYTFDTSDSSNTAALRFYEDTAQTTEYTTGVTVTGTAGTAGASTSIVPTETTPRILYAQVDGTPGLGFVVLSVTSDQASADVETAKTAAQTAATNAATSESNASTSEGNASTSESNAQGYATDAFNYTFIAGTRTNDNAEYYAQQAGTSASNAASFASSASDDAALALGYRNTANSAKTDAETARDTILSAVDDNLWLGGYTTANLPTTYSDGTALLTGAAAYDLTLGATQIWNGSAWEGTAGSIASTSLTDSSELVRNNADQTITGTVTATNFSTATGNLNTVIGNLANAPQIEDVTNRGYVQNINQALTTTSTVNFNSLTLAGDLTVNGTTTTIDTTNLAVTDSLIVLSQGLSGTPANDAGIIIERGSETNAVMAWDEVADEFVFGTTAADGSTAGNHTITDADLRVADLTLSGIAAGSTTTATGSTTWDVTAAQMAIVTASGETQITLSNASLLPTGAGLTLIVNDAASASLHTTPIDGTTTIKYPSGTAPTISGTAGEVLVVSLIHTGSGNYIASNVTVSTVS